MDEETRRLQWGYRRALKERDKRLDKTPYTRLPQGHPDFDAEDLPRAWQRWGLEILTCAGIILALGLVAWAAQPLGPVLPNFLDWLTRVLT